MNSRKPIHLEALLEKADLLSNVFSSIQDGISILDAQLNIVSVNAAHEKWYAHAMPLVGKRCYQAYHGRETPCVVCPSQQTLRTRQKAYEVVPKVGKGGEVVGWLDLYSFPLMDSKTGKLLGVIEYVRDISNQKKAEKALRESEERYRSLFKNASVAVFQSRPDGTIVDVNPEFVRMFGYRSQQHFLETVKNARDLFVNPEHRAELVQRLQKNPSSMVFENRYRRADGTEFIGLLKINAKKDRHGNVFLFEGFIEDITERQRVENALRESEERYRSLVEHSWQGILIAEGPPFRFMFCNPAAAQMLGYTVDALTRLSPEDILGLIHPEDRSIAGQRFTSMMTKGAELPPGRFRLIRKDGTMRWVETYGRKIVHQGRPALQVALLDITERKQAEMLLQESEERYRSFVQNFQGIAFRGTLDFKPTFFHGAVQKITGYTEADFLSGNPRWNQIILAEDLEIIKPGMNNIHETPNYAEERGYRILRKDGQIRWVHEWIQNFCDDVQKPIGVQGAIYDITGRKEAENALRKNMERLRLVTENMADTVSQMDARNRIVYVSPSIKRVFGYEIRDVLGTGIFDWVHPDDASKIGRMVREARRTGLQSLRLVYRHKHVDGGYLWVESDARLLYNDRGGSAGAVFGTRDMTERKLAEEALKESEANFSALAQNAHDAILIAVDDRSHEYANRRAEELTGYKIKELLKTGSVQLIHPQEKKKIESLFSKKTTTKTLRRQYETVLIRKDKTSIPVEVSVSKTVWHGKSADLVFVRNIAERKKMEEQIRQDVQEKEVLLKEIHHRVKNNMQIISSLLNLQSQFVKDEQSLNQFRESQNRIRSVALIHEKLYSSGNLAKVDFGDYVRDFASHLVRTYTTTAGFIQLNINIESVFLNVNAAIPCGLIINELVSNALKYAFPTPRPTLKSKPHQIQIDLHPFKQKQYELVVRDNGIGLPGGFDIEKNNTLGLRIVKALASQLEGTMRMKNEGGAVFSMVFKA